MFTLRIPVISLCTTLILAALTPSLAQFQPKHGYINSNPSAANKDTLWTVAEYVDFSSASPNTPRQWPTFMENGVPTKKFYAFQIFANPKSGSQCFEISTARGATGFQDAQTENPNADTFLYMRQKGGTTIHVPIQDDIGGVDEKGQVIRYSKFRVWSIKNLNTYYRAAAYSTGYNSMDFYVIVKAIKVSTKDECKLAGLPLINTETPNPEYITE
jgi:hypothetical protein